MLINIPFSNNPSYNNPLSVTSLKKKKRKKSLSLSLSPRPDSIASPWPPQAFALQVPSKKSPRMRHLLLPAPRQASPAPAVQALSPSPGPGPQIPALPMAALAQACQFGAALAFFHVSEYVLAVAFHGRRNVTLTCAYGAAFLISKQYCVELSFIMLEHLTEALLFPELKGYWFISNAGLLMVLIGEIIRTIAVVTAGRSFTHVIKIQYEDDHQLITHGCIVSIASALVLWRFFSKRITYEEFFLRQFFGSQYEEYARKVHSGLPFIK